jgi:hypothetical protein
MQAAGRRFYFIKLAGACKQGPLPLPLALTNSLERPLRE